MTIVIVIYPTSSVVVGLVVSRFIAGHSGSTMDNVGVGC
jgi:hypothetical protein